MTWLISYGSALVVFVLVDMAWLGTMSSRVYRPVIGDILAAKFNLAAASMFYLLYPVGLVIFAVNPALKAGSLAQAATLGALLGFFSYATYDLTNQATLRSWSTTLSAVDMAWGTVLGAIAASASFWITTKFAG